MHAQYNMLLTLKRQHHHDGPSAPKSRRTRQRLNRLITQMDSTLRQLPNKGGAASIDI